MGIHSRAWAGVHHLIFSDEDLVPMRIEQSLAQASPANEVGFDSFEDYGDALDHCRERTDAGFIILSEKHKTLPVIDIFRNFANAYEQASGFPAYGVVFHSGNETVEGYRLLVDEPRLLDYVPSAQLTDKSGAYHFLIDKWQKYVDRFNEHLVPTPLQKTYYSICEKEGFSKSDIQFTIRITNLLTDDLNLSWLSMQALNWIHVSNYLQTARPEILTANLKLANVCSLAKFTDNSTSDPIGTITQEGSLASRTAATIAMLNEARRSGQLDRVTNEIAAFAKPGKPALIRLIKKKQAQILRIAEDIQHSNDKEHQKVS